MAAAKQKAKAAVQSILDRYWAIVKANRQDYQGFDRRLMRDIKLIDASPEGAVTWELAITPAYANLNNVMHGGAAGVIFDMCTTTALGPVMKHGYWEFLGGVSRTINISYLRAIPIGTTVRLHSQVLQHGRTMALIRGTMTSADGKTVYATAEHHKVNVPMTEENRSVRIPWDDDQDRERELEAEKSKL